MVMEYSEENHADCKLSAEHLLASRFPHHHMHQQHHIKCTVFFYVENIQYSLLDYCIVVL